MKRTNKFYRKNEIEVMKKLGFKPTKNSGSGWIEKEDGISQYCICQLKSTDKESISIKYKDMLTLSYNADISHKIPIFAIQFIKTDETWILIRPDDLPDVQGIVSENKKNVNNDVFTVDTSETVCYDNDAELLDNVREHSIMARKAYIHKKERENEERREARKRRKS